MTASLPNNSISAIIRSPEPNGTYRSQRFEHPIRVIQADQLDEVIPALAEIEAESKAGQYAVGWISYEASPAFDRAYKTHPADGFPLLWFGIFDEAVTETLCHCSSPPANPESISWKADTSEAEFHNCIAAIKELITSGDTYQVNYSFRLKAHFEGDAEQLFNSLAQAQPSARLMYIDTGDHVICSASPELFYEQDGSRIHCKPMKGTSPRGLTFENDVERANELQRSVKNRAENIMIVDMIRNDLGRIAEIGSVKVSDRFAIEKHPSLFQMTSTVTAETRAGLPEVMQALFPCSSITGAPKVRTMEIIRDLESSPRGIYTGCLGSIEPGGKTNFNVAIRTVQIDRNTQRACYGTGSGVVWDSSPEGEYNECLVKTQILFEAYPEFDLLETLRWTPEEEYFLLDQHMNRVSKSSAYFDIPLDPETLRAELLETAKTFEEASYKVRVLINPLGAIYIKSVPIDLSIPTHFKIALDRQASDSKQLFYYHKTTNRSFYDEARARFPEMDDVLLWNERGELTESTMANLVLKIDEQLVTPRVASGLLYGSFRDKLLSEGTLQEKILYTSDLEQAEEIWLINSVRGWISVELALS